MAIYFAGLERGITTGWTSAWIQTSGARLARRLPVALVGMGPPGGDPMPRRGENVLPRPARPDMLPPIHREHIMNRRSFLRAGVGVAASALPRIAIAQPAKSRVLRFVPQANLTLLDPIFT